MRVLEYTNQPIPKPHNTLPYPSFFSYISFNCDLIQAYLLGIFIFFLTSIPLFLLDFPLAFFTKFPFIVVLGMLHTVSQERPS